MNDAVAPDATSPSLENNGVPAEPAPASHEPLYSRLRRIRDEVAKGSKPEASPREILSWFGAQRRGINVAARIRRELADHDLATFPDFEYEFIDGLVFFVPKPAPKPQTPKGPEAEVTAVPPAVTQQTEQPDSAATETPIVTDPTYRIGKLAAANQRPVSVAPDTEINKAVTLMLQHDYSQLPVMAGTRTVKGMFSWNSLAVSKHFGHVDGKVADCMGPCHVISSEASIFDAVSDIVRHGVVVVRDQTNEIVGIVTTTDLSLQFRQLGEPFLVLGEIENHLRQLLDSCFTSAELEAVRDSADSTREIHSAADLTFGEYIVLIENPERWEKLKLPLDRKVFVDTLDNVRLIRNDVMHFDPDGIGEDDLRKVREFAAFLQTLANVNSKNNGT